MITKYHSAADMDRRRSTVVVVDGSGWKWPDSVRKRETEKKGNTPVNTGPSPNSDGRANNLVEEADEPAR
ncbi:hypothetical protein T03_11376 [Trichinella britovi]|uniref:Uncharacterized protein n=1 Tax=Trichinella britovi TaxID=45882 RepID=A0A0V1D5G9_TRIBR|nr:hypothetical protein T03_11376 [Trichinella britovi]